MTAPALTAALAYAARGWPVLPVNASKAPLTEHGFHDASTDTAIIGGWWQRWPDAGVAVATGAPGPVVVDLDSPEAAEALRALSAAHGPLSAPAHSETPRGFHLLYGDPGGIGRHIGKLGAGIDVLGAGGYAVLPPGDGRSWTREPRGTLAPLPSWIAGSCNGATPSRSAPQTAEEAIPQGQRDHTLASLAGSMRRRGMAAGEIEAALQAVNERRCRPPLPCGDVQRIAASVARYRPAQAVTPSEGDGARVAPESGRPGNGRAVVAEPFTAIKMRRSRWLWSERLPLGTVSVLAGLQGLGKSTLALKLAADLTRGTLDGDLASHPVDVLVVSLEDAAETVVVPRFLAAGGDPRRAHRLKITHDGADSIVELPTDVTAIEAEATRVKARLVVVDPISAALASDVDSHRDAGLRRALAPLAAMAERLDLVVLVVAHLRKSADSEPLYRVGGSVALTAAARSVLMMTTERPEDGAERDEDPELLLAHAKSNHGRLAATLRGRIDSASVATDDGDTIGTSRWIGLGEDSKTARELFGLPDSPEVESPERDDAESFLRGELAAEPVPAKQVQSAARDAGIAPRTLRRAKGALGVESFRQSAGNEGAGQWFWALPGTDSQGGHGQGGHATDGKGGHLANRPSQQGIPAFATGISSQGVQGPEGGHLANLANEHGRLPLADARQEAAFERACELLPEDG